MFESKEGLKWFGETGMDCENQTLPGPALGHDLWKSLTNKSEIDEDYFAAQWFGEGIVRELPIVIQDMDFYLDIEKVFRSFNYLFTIEDLLTLCHNSCFLCSYHQFYPDHDYANNPDGGNGDRSVMFQTIGIFLYFFNVHTCAFLDLCHNHNDRWGCNNLNGNAAY